MGEPHPMGVMADALELVAALRSLEVVDRVLTGEEAERRAGGPALHIDEYAQIQGDLYRELARHGVQGWSINSDHWHQDGTYHSGGGFTSMLPLILARRDGPDALACTTAILRDRPASEHDWLANHTDGWTLTPTSMRIDIYDLGMAVMNGTFTVRAPKELGLRTIASVLKQVVWLKPGQSGALSPIAATFRTLADETTHQFANAIAAAAPHAIRQPWLAPFLKALAEDPQPGTHSPDDWGRLLWLHPVHLLEVDDREQLDTSATQLAPPFNRPVDIPDGRFISGIGWSALVTNRRPTDIDVPLRLLELHWAYIALYMEIDRGLLALLDRDHWHQPDTLPDLEKDADSVFADYIRVMEARARVDSALASLGGDEQAIWDVIADVTKFDALVQGVDRKVEVLQRIAERRVQQATAARSRRTSAILRFLTALTIVTVTVALITNFLGSRSDHLGHIDLRILIVGAALVASIGLYREAYRPRRRKHHSPRRKRGGHSLGWRAP